MADIAELDQLIQTLPLFEKVAKSAMKKMLDEKHMSFRSYAPGDVIVRQGELDTEFFILIEGLASAYRTEEDGQTRLVASYGAGDFFGEMSAVSHQPRSATVKADGPCIVMMIDVTLFQLLFNDKKSSFAKIIDERYRERALAFHLMTAPLFKNTSPDDLKRIAEKAELVSFAKGDVLAEEGKPAEAVYLVRSGIIKRSVRSPTGEEIIHDYLCDNSSFGERSLMEGAVWDFTSTAMSHVDLVRLPAKVFAEVFGSGEQRTRIQEQVDVLLAEEQGISTQIPESERFELLIGKEAIKGTEALVIDLGKCTRCNACVESCVAVHEDRVPRLSKRGIREGDLMLSSACYNCKIPECMLSCKFGAIRRDVEGQIHILGDNCVGCNMCEASCPYGVIRMAHILTEEEAAADREARSPWRSIPLIGPLIQKRAASKKAGEGDEAPKKAGKAKAIKCDLCAGLPFEACVYNCPCGAIARRSPTALAGLEV